MVSLGTMPPSNAIVPISDEAIVQNAYPLDVLVCQDCWLMQLSVTVPATEIFSDEYPYFSSFSDSLLRHHRIHARQLIQAEQLDGSSFVVEVASNDGYLLKNFVNEGIPVVGIDPAKGPVEAAIKNGVPTRHEFFGNQLATSMVAEGLKADVILANNVLAHVESTNDFVAGLSTLVSDSGTVIVEFPWLVDLMQKSEFDTIYHEHLCYFSLTAVVSLFARHGLQIHDVERLDIHGGSLRVHASRSRKPTFAVASLLDKERALGVTSTRFYDGFAEQIRSVCTELNQKLKDLKSAGARIAAYGAAAKGATMLNCSDIDERLIDFVVDRNCHKQGHFMPGSRIPIVAPERLMTEAPDYVLLLAWNFQEEIIEQQQAYLNSGGRFIVPIPYPHIIANAFDSQFRNSLAKAA